MALRRREVAAEQQLAEARAAREAAAGEERRARESGEILADKERLLRSRWGAWGAIDRALAQRYVSLHACKLRPAVGEFAGDPQCRTVHW